MGGGAGSRRIVSVVLGLAPWALTGCELIGGLDDKTLAPSAASATSSSASTGAGGAGGSIGCPKEAYPDSTPFCSDGTQQVPCDDPSAIAGQDGLHVGLQQTFEFEDPGGMWVRDLSTKLVWRNVPMAFGGNPCPELAGIASKTPPLFYLLSIVDFGFAPRASPYFMTTDTFASSVTHTVGPTGISFANGALDETIPADAQLRCVAGDYSTEFDPDDRTLVPDVPGTPTTFFDPDTHLTWAAAYKEVSTWSGAVAYCASRPPPADGCGAWRLPSVKELLSVMNPEGYMNVAFFGPGDDAHNPARRKYWSSTFVAAKPTDVWAVHFGTFGNDSNNTTLPFDSIQPTMVARCVR